MAKETTPNNEEKEIIKDKVFLNAQQHVIELFKKSLPTTMLYHNYLHTDRSLERLEDIFKEEDFTEQEKHILRLAVLFQDTGYITSFKEPTKESIGIAKDYLQSTDVKEEVKNTVLQCIKASDELKPSSNELENICKDVKHFAVAHKRFEDFNELIKSELEVHANESFSDAEWRQKQLTFYTKEHRFYSTYAVKNWENRKQRNISKLIEDSKKEKKNEEKEKKKAYYKEKFRKENPERSIQTLYRVALRC
jgi:hypothetical protein